MLYRQALSTHRPLLAPSLETSPGKIGLNLAAVWGPDTATKKTQVPDWENWPVAATKAAHSILGQTNKKALLIFVDGVDYSVRLGGQDNDPAPITGIDQTPDLGNGLRGVAGNPVFPNSSQIVYSAHNYQVDVKQDTGPGMSTQDFNNNLRNWWGYLLEPACTLPVWLSEFGTCNFQESSNDYTTPGPGTSTMNDPGSWFTALANYLKANNVDWGLALP